MVVVKGIMGIIIATLGQGYTVITLGHHGCHGPITSNSSIIITTIVRVPGGGVGWWGNDFSGIGQQNQLTGQWQNQ